MRVVESIEIERPPEDVWAVISDPGTHVRWRPSVREFRPVADGPLAVGSHVREVLAWRGREIVLDDVVTALDAPRRLGIRGGWTAADFELELVLEPVAQGTKVTMDWPFYPKRFLVKLAAPFMGGAMRKATREELELLKAYVERNDARSVTPE
jgi:polyketide cyclase/dehydrase/lipid transport protein